MMINGETNYGVSPHSRNRQGIVELSLSPRKRSNYVSPFAFYLPELFFGTTLAFVHHSSCVGYFFSIMEESKEIILYKSRMGFAISSMISYFLLFLCLAAKLSNQLRANNKLVNSTISWVGCYSMFSSFWGSVNDSLVLNRCLELQESGDKSVNFQFLFKTTILRANLGLPMFVLCLAILTSLRRGTIHKINSTERDPDLNRQKTWLDRLSDLLEDWVDRLKNWLKKLLHKQPSNPATDQPPFPPPYSSVNPQSIQFVQPAVHHANLWTDHQANPW